MKVLFQNFQSLSLISSGVYLYTVLSEVVPGKFLPQTQSGTPSTNTISIYTVYSLCNPRDHCTHSLFQDCCLVELDYIEPPNSFTHGYNFVAGNIIVPQWLPTIRQAPQSSLHRRREVIRLGDGKSDRWSQHRRFCLFSPSKRNNNSRNWYTSKNVTFSQITTYCWLLHFNR